MIRYELKKVFASLGSKIALVLLAAAVAISCWTAVNGYGTEWINAQGDPETGPAAVRKIRRMQKEWAGPLDTQRLTAAMVENQRINATPEALSNDDALNDIAFGWKQGISDIREVVNHFLSRDFSTYDYYLADNVSLNRLPGLYENRVKLLQEFLYSEESNAFHQYTEAEKQWLVMQYEALEVPMAYDYYLGWKQLTGAADMPIMLLVIIVGYLVAGIFANEFKWKADCIYFSSMWGRTSGTKAKIMAGFLLVTALYWACILVYSLYTLAYLGADGWNCPVQLDRWKCFYNITYLEKYLLTVWGGYLGNLFSAFLVMWISARSRSAVVAVTAPFLLIFLPNFFQNYEGSLVGKILGLMPDRLLQINNALNYFDLYSLGGAVTGAIPVLLALYVLLTAALVPALYRTFGRKQLV